MTYELLAYLSVRVTQIGMRVCEISVMKAYLKTERISAKIRFFRGNGELLGIFLKNAMGLIIQGKAVD
ncbi:MAG: hypothetical protein HFG22_03510 [Lachnospiraceae bacterium]|nr:hypothetical protein [Lachnospiraceae bacterium]